MNHNDKTFYPDGNEVGSGEVNQACPTPAKVDGMIRQVAIAECDRDEDCLVTEQCCETTDRIAVCITAPNSKSEDPVISTTSGTSTTTSGTSTITSGTSTTTSDTISNSTSTTSTTSGTSTIASDTSSTTSGTSYTTSGATSTSTSTVRPDDLENNVGSKGRSERGPDEPVPGQGQNGTNGTIYKVGNDLVNRRYLLPPDWRSITFVDRKIRLNNGKIMSFDFYFEDTRVFLDGMFPGMRLQVGVSFIKL